MNKFDRKRRLAESVKQMYPPGTRIELICMNDPYSPVPSGTRGTVRAVDDMGTIFPDWDNGRSLGVVPGEDVFRKLSREEIEAENKSSSLVEEETLATVYKGNIIKNLIMDCQSYTKYRPNETTGGIFVSWRRKEELPTGA